MKTKKFLAIVLALAMVFSMSVAAFAVVDDTPNTGNQPTIQENTEANTPIKEEETTPRKDDERPSASAANGETPPRDLSLPFAFEHAGDGFVISTLSRGAKLAEEELKKLGDVLVDFQNVAESDYTAKVEDGKLAIDFSDAFKSALSSGKHMINVMFDGFNYGSVIDVPYK